jgi:glycosyltransferase involved in cell wall biosynthesis
MRRRAAELARNVVLLARTAAHHATDDPLLLVVQVARRLPARTREPVARLVRAGTGGHGTRAALAAFVADRPDDAAAILRAGPSRGRLAAELAVHLGVMGTASAGGPPVRATTAARAAWQRGDITAAVGLAGGSRPADAYRRRLVAERHTMEPGYRLRPPTPPVAVAAGRAGDRSPRALHVLTNSLPWTASGYSLRSHAVLRAQQQAGIDVEAVTRIGYPVTVGLPWARSVDEVDGVRYRRVVPTALARTPDRRLEQMAVHVERLVREIRPTVLHTTTNYTNALVTEAVARAAGLPWVYEVRGQLEKTWLASRPAAERDAAAASERYALLHAKETEMALAADHVVTLSTTLRADLVERGVDARRITVVPNGVDEDLLELRLSSAEARARLGLPVAGFWVGTVSSLVDYEGLDTLLDAVAQLRWQGLDARGAIVGDGVSRPGLLARAEELGLSGAVTFPGRVDRDEAALWHRALDVFVVPRRDVPVCRAVTPLKPVEAMAVGRPVVVSDLPALREIVTEPGTGLAVPAGDVSALAAALDGLARDPDTRGQYGEAGRRFAATRTWRGNGELYRRIYRSLGAGS